MLKPWQLIESDKKKIVHTGSTAILWLWWLWRLLLFRIAFRIDWICTVSNCALVMGHSHGSCYALQMISEVVSINNLDYLTAYWVSLRKLCRLWECYIHVICYVYIDIIVYLFMCAHKSSISLWASSNGCWLLSYFRLLSPNLILPSANS